MENRVKQHLSRVYALSADEVGELFEVGRDTVLEAMDCLERAIAARDALNAREMGHMLKGTLYNMGLEDLAEEARALEIEAKDGSMAEVERIFVSVSGQLRGFAKIST